MNVKAIVPAYAPWSARLLDTAGNVVLIDVDTIPTTLTCAPTGTITADAGRNPFPSSVTATERSIVNRASYFSERTFFWMVEYSYNTTWELLSLQLIRSSGSLVWRARVRTTVFINGGGKIYEYEATKSFSTADASPKGIYSGWSLYAGDTGTPAMITLGDLTIS